MKSKDGKTVTFRYDKDKAKQKAAGTVYEINATHSDKYDTYPTWTGTYEKENTTTTEVVFDKQFKNYQPTSTKYWFFSLTEMTQIKGLENLNTSKVTNMSNMFNYCKKLKSIDVSKLNTDNVTDMSGMFLYCSSVSVFNFSKFNTEKVTDMNSMFLYCAGLVTLDIANFNTAKVMNMESMFRGCDRITTIICNDKWTCGKSKEMFLGCTNLKGKVGYDRLKVDVAMASPEGYFTKKSATGISATTASMDATIKAVYSTDGKLQTELQRGLNIVRMSDGTTRKVIKK
ncbi:BspA family leucine-rich repeat surface protein [Prevotella sp. HUN102]|uniref:BspA family leucine-rich repeat surface protein n=1 Tax=Prevotella sp. HUN102 TaxID=1392486 RepID=UPI0006898526|nr:BspA family leucine-rich repeat surface protein [Prevotella sp. HUN102]